MIMLLFGLIKVLNLSKNRFFGFSVSIIDLLGVLILGLETFPTLISNRSLFLKTFHVSECFESLAVFS